MDEIPSEELGSLGVVTSNGDDLMRPDAPRQENVVVYQEAGRYGGWPANNGIWSWGDEIVVGFVSAAHQPSTTGHAVDATKPKHRWQARSLDGGESWAIEKPAIFMAKTAPGLLPAPLTFTGKDFALKFAFHDLNVGPSHYFVSSNRCRKWNGPYQFSVFGIDKVTARTDYIVENSRRCLVFASAAKADGKEGRPFCARTDDGGLTWHLVARIDRKPAGYLIMPSSVRLKDGSLFTTIRRCDPGQPSTIDAYRSVDNGAHWTSLGVAAHDTGSNPPSLVLLRDGRLCLTYGCRVRPFGIRARISDDSGATWRPEIILRDDGLSADLGYPRSVQRPDGRIVTIYYFNGPREEDRTIQATIWQP